MLCNSVLNISFLLTFICPVVIASGSPNLEGYPDQLKLSKFTRVGNKLYHFSRSKANWFKANLICRSMGGYLAAFDNQQEFEELTDYLENEYSTYRWW
ncbi:C-type lectin 37Db-like [Musca domestica]|uniref:C-type lectin 37Db-like n=1 Tax=Musca domestica TaxID=7370 RepID=A0A9J7DLY1_MUSDO|nr:C-type lectin 37Db-like [Musca domestica]